MITFEYGLTRLGFSNGLAEVYKNGKWGLINENNEFVISPELDYSDILYCPEWDMLQVRMGQYGNYRYGFIDRNGTVKIFLVYNECYGVSEGLSAARFGPICGFLDKDGEWTIPFLYSKVSPFFEGLAAVKQNGKADFIDVPANSDYAQAVAWAVENNITSGTGGSNFSPAATCNRGQIVAFLHRAMGK